MTENEANEVYEEPTVPQYQIQLENLDFEVKKLKNNLFILEQEHTREKIRINSKLDSAKRALEKPLKDLEKSKNNDDNMKGEDWGDEEWKTIIKIFNSGRDAERIVIKSPYKIQGYGDNGNEETYGGSETSEFRNMLRREPKKI